jgi:phosphoglycolate phosphatase
MKTSPASTLKHLLWDWNGTLLNDVDASFNAINRLLAEHRLPGVTRADYLAHFGFPVRDYYHHIGFSPGLSPSQWQSIANAYHDHFNAGPQALFPDALAALQRVQSAGFPQSVLSALYHPMLMRDMARHNVAGFFTHTRGAADINGGSKLETGRQLLHDLALPPDAFLLIGDTLHDAHVARELGVQCVLVSRGHCNPQRLASANVPVFPSLTHAVKDLHEHP